MKRIIFIPFFAIIFFACSHKATQNTLDQVTGINAIEKKIEVEAEIAKIQCLELCRGAIREDLDLNSGPCIGNPIPNMENWVCDIAHSPRQSVDDKTENQCSVFRDGTAKHFIELDSDCNFIKSY